MGDKTGISWTDSTFNPWWGCTKVSEACRNCYAEATDARYGGGGDGHWGVGAPRRFFGDSHWAEPLKWNRKAERDGISRRVFCGSMCDWAEDRPDLVPQRVRLMNLIRETPALDWLLLTKRAGNLDRMLPWYLDGRQVDDPWRNVWVGVTAEDTEHVLDRVLALRQIEATVRFVSMEPLIELIGAEILDHVFGSLRDPSSQTRWLGPVHWAIVGDESGGTSKSPARPCDVEWVRIIRDACLRHHVAFHFKQWAGRVVPDGVIDERERPGAKIHLPVLDGRRWSEFPR